jgi:hypothetical protein
VDGVAKAKMILTVDLQSAPETQAKEVMHDEKAMNSSPE